MRVPCCLLWKPPPVMSSCPKNSVSPSLWYPPPTRTLKWNVDASFDPNLSHAAVGGVLRDDRGCFTCIFSNPIPCMEINSAEVFAIFRALKISIHSERVKHQKIIIESDSINVVRWCNEHRVGPWNLNFNLNFIRNVRRSWMNISITHKGRNSNTMVYVLAKQGLRRCDEFLAWC